MPTFNAFHVPAGPELGYLPKILADKQTSLNLISPFLFEGEQFSWDGPYNTKDPLLATRPGQSMGRIFVSNLRLIFWSDDATKPHAAVFYDDIQGWKSSWMPFKSKGITMIVGDRKVIFAANSTAIENAERYIRS
jgi:hypothetical protein